MKLELVQMLAKSALKVSIAMERTPMSLAMIQLRLALKHPKHALQKQPLLDTALPAPLFPYYALQADSATRH
jgi:hypothetical protein